MITQMSMDPYDVLLSCARTTAQTVEEGADALRAYREATADLARVFRRLKAMTGQDPLVKESWDELESDAMTILKRVDESAQLLNESAASMKAAADDLERHPSSVVRSKRQYICARLPSDVVNSLSVLFYHLS